MSPERRKEIKQLTDEELVNEFVRRFDVDAACIIFVDEGHEYGFGKWRNKAGRDWFNQLKDERTQ
jgi:hypothetical protein